MCCRVAAFSVLLGRGAWPRLYAKPTRLPDRACGCTVRSTRTAVPYQLYGKRAEMLRTRAQRNTFENTPVWSSRPSPRRRPFPADPPYLKRRHPTPAARRRGTPPPAGPATSHLAAICHMDYPVVWACAILQNLTLVLTIVGEGFTTLRYTVMMGGAVVSTDISPVSRATEA